MHADTRDCVLLDQHHLQAVTSAESKQRNVSDLFELVNDSLELGESFKGMHAAVFICTVAKEAVQHLEISVHRAALAGSLVTARCLRGALLILARHQHPFDAVVLSRVLVCEHGRNRRSAKRDSLYASKHVRLEHIYDAAAVY